MQLTVCSYHNRVVNRPFPVRAKYARNACVGTGVQGDYVSAKINTQIYMGLMEKIAVFSTSF